MDAEASIFRPNDRLGPGIGDDEVYYFNLNSICNSTFEVVSMYSGQSRTGPFATFVLDRNYA